MRCMRFWIQPDIIINKTGSSFWNFCFTQLFLPAAVSHPVRFHLIPSLILSVWWHQLSRQAAPVTAEAVFLLSIYLFLIPCWLLSWMIIRYGLLLLQQSCLEVCQRFLTFAYVLCFVSVLCILSTNIRNQSCSVIWIKGVLYKRLFYAFCGSSFKRPHLYGVAFPICTSASTSVLHTFQNCISTHSLSAWHAVRSCGGCQSTPVYLSVFFVFCITS